jgi:nucleotide-binding universal stress UspA family protein
MRKLLVPFDASANALRALRHAVALAEASGAAGLVIVHAHEPAHDYGRVAAYRPTAEIEDLQRRHSEEILAPAIRAAKEAGISFETRILTGDISHEIVDCAENEGCDGIVMGTRGMGAVGNLVLGSVATKVIHLTKLPVTLVK